MNYLVKYTSYILYDKWFNDLKNKNKDYNVSTYSISSNTVNDVLEDLNTYSLFGNNKIVVLDDIMMLNDTSSDFKSLINYLKNPNKDYIFIMVDSNLNNTRKTIKEIKKYSNYVFLEDNPLNFLSSRLKDYKISMINKNLILSYTNNNIDSIDNECNKLIEYKDKGEEITKEDIENVCYKRLDDYTPLAFSLTSNIAKKDSYNALKDYLEFKKYNVDDQALTGLIESELRVLKIIAKMKDLGYSDSEISSNKHVSNPPISSGRVYVMSKLLRYVNEKDINSLIHSFYNLDLSIKNGTNISDNPLELFLLNL